jgi:CheY-like chemotaxis protein
VGVKPVAEPTKEQVVNQNGQILRVLVLNDDTTVCKLIGQMLDFYFACEFEPVGRSETAIQRLLEGKYDLILLDSRLPDVAVAELPAAITAVYQTIPKERRYPGGVTRWTEGERLFRLLRSPDVTDLGWVTDVGLVPVIFLTGAARDLDRATIRTMPPVAILGMPTDLDQLIGEIIKLTGVAPAAE